MSLLTPNMVGLSSREGRGLGAAAVIATIPARAWRRVLGFMAAVVVAMRSQAGVSR
jgi:hypothetical protein